LNSIALRAGDPSGRLICSSIWSAVSTRVSLAAKPEWRPSIFALVPFSALPGSYPTLL
jgi:hypothetical protein